MDDDSYEITMQTGHTIAELRRRVIGQSRQGQRRGVSGKSRHQPRLHQGAAHEAEQGQTRENVDDQIEGMIAPHVQPADAIVECEGEIQPWPARNRDRSIVLRWRPRLPQTVKGGIVLDRKDIIENKGHMKTVRIGRERGTGNDGTAQDDPSLGGRPVLARRRRCCIHGFHALRSDGCCLARVASGRSGTESVPMANSGPPPLFHRTAGMGPPLARRHPVVVQFAFCFRFRGEAVAGLVEAGPGSATPATSNCTTTSHLGHGPALGAYASWGAVWGMMQESFRAE